MTASENQLLSFASPSATARASMLSGTTLPIYPPAVSEAVSASDVSPAPAGISVTTSCAEGADGSNTSGVAATALWRRAGSRRLVLIGAAFAPSWYDPAAGIAIGSAGRRPSSACGCEEPLMRITNIMAAHTAAPSISQPEIPLRLRRWWWL